MFQKLSEFGGMTAGVCNDTEGEQQTIRKNRPSAEQLQMTKSVLEVMKESGGLKKKSWGDNRQAF